MFACKRVLKSPSYRRKKKKKNKKRRGKGGKKKERTRESKKDTRILYQLWEELIEIKMGFRMISLVLSVFLKFDVVFLLIIMN